MIYRTDGRTFMNVSLGRDGRSDGTHFWQLVDRPVKDRTAEKRRCASPDADARSRETIDHVRAASEPGVRPNPRVQRTRVARCARPGSPLTRHPLGVGSTSHA